MKKMLLALLLGFFTPFIIAGIIYATVNCTLAWDAPSGSYGITGYKVYWGTVSRTYPNVIDAGLNLQKALTGLPDTGPIYFAVTDYTATQESA